MKTIYLSGGIVGHTYEGATSWREYLKASLSRHFQILDPMRGKDELKNIRGVITNNTPYDPVEVFRRDLWDIRQSNIVVVNWPTIQPKGVGTAAEAMFAWQRGKDIISVVDEVYKKHPFVIGMSDAMVDSLEGVISECMRLA